MEETIHDKAKAVQRNASAQGLQAVAGFPIPISSLMSPIRELQEQVAVQAEVLKEFLTGMQVCF